MAMPRSTERFLTTHAGSLPRPADLIRMMFAKEEGIPVEPQALARRVRDAVADIVRRQSEAGIDIVVQCRDREWRRGCVLGLEDPDGEGAERELLAALDQAAPTLAQMIGLWIRRAPMSEDQRRSIGQQLFPFFKQLTENDLPSDPFTANAIAPGWYGTASRN